MYKASLLENISYREDSKPSVSVILKTANTKEMRIVMKAGQFMKEHTAPFPIIVEIFEGEIDFGIKGISHKLLKGDIIALEANIPHDLTCVSDCIIRLSLSVADRIERVTKLTH
ncbi:cupin domain-containing protein [Membranihabitans marinus]|uniref:cupin domain-containing protein n=1 Tax=Membranihabitans marinus TaxID=1227546 RepID=UPI001F2CB78F|nr:cupin domain-containing protein [Membranihabitans marinus]